MAKAEIARFGAAALTALALLLSAPVATAGPDPSMLTADEREVLGGLFEAARIAFEEERWPDAIAALQEAWKIFPEPNILYRIGDAHERAGELAEAITFYERYVSQSPESRDTGLIQRRVADLRRRIEDQSRPAAQPEETIGAILVLDTTPTGAEVYVDGDGTSRGRTPIRLELAPGPYHVKVALDGYRPAERVVKLESGDTASLVYALERTSEPARPSALPWVVGGVGIAALGAAGGLFAVSLGAGGRVDGYDSDREAAYAAGEAVPQRPADYDALTQREFTFQRAAIGTAIGGAVLLVGAVVWLLVRPDSDSGAAAWIVGPGNGELRVLF